VAYSLIDMANKSLGPGMGTMPGAGAGPGVAGGAGAMVAVGRSGSEISGWVLAVALMAEVAVMVLMTVWRMRSVEIAPGAGAQ